MEGDLLKEEGDQMERIGTQNGTKGHKMERRDTRWDGGTQDGTKGDQM